MKSRILLLLMALPIVAAAHTIEKIDIWVQLHRDGSARVTETRRCNITDEGTEGFIRFYNMKDVWSSDWAVSDETGTKYDFYGKWNSKWSRKQKTNRCGTISTSKGLELC